MSDQSDLRAAFLAEIAAAQLLREASGTVDSVIDQLITAGVPYDSIARASLRVRLGRAPTMLERQRETQRLRQRRRRAVAGRHGYRGTAGIASSTSAVGSSQEAQMTQRLIKRTSTTVEEFLDDAHDDCGETKASAADDTDAEDEGEGEGEADEPTGRGRRSKKS